MTKPTVKRTVVTDFEQIFEISHNGIGCLMSVAAIGNELIVNLYRNDPGVQIVAPARRHEYETIEQIKAACPNYFSRDTMRFFRSRIMGTVYPGGYFVTSERYSDETGRYYTLRRATCTAGKCSVETIGDFQEYATRMAAIRAAKQAAKEFLAGR